MSARGGSPGADLVLLGAAGAGLALAGLVWLWGGTAGELLGHGWPALGAGQSVGVLMPGHLVADTMAVMASLDPIMGGVDK